MFRQIEKGIPHFSAFYAWIISYEMYVVSARNVIVFTCKVRGRGRLQSEEECGICHCQGSSAVRASGKPGSFTYFFWDTSAIKVSSEAERNTQTS